jgi:hypothetical protein
MPDPVNFKNSVKGLTKKPTLWYYFIIEGNNILHEGGIPF